MSVPEVLNGGQAHVSSEVKAPKANRKSPSSSPKLRSDAHRELPPGWERVHTDQGIYYWQKETGKTRWKFPEEEAKQQEKLRRAHNYVNVKPVHPLVRATASCSEIGEEMRTQHQDATSTSDTPGQKQPQVSNNPTQSSQQDTLTAGTEAELGTEKLEPTTVRKSSQEEMKESSDEPSGLTTSISRKPRVSRKPNFITEPRKERASSVSGGDRNSKSVSRKKASETRERRTSSVSGSDSKPQSSISRHAKYVNDPHDKQPSSVSSSDSKPHSSISRHAKYVNDPHDKQPSSVSERDSKPQSGISRHAKYVNDRREEQPTSVSGSDSKPQSNYVNDPHDEQPTSMSSSDSKPKSSISRHAKYVNDRREEQPTSVSGSDSKPKSNYVNDPHDEQPTSVSGSDSKPKSSISRHAKYVNDPRNEQPTSVSGSDSKPKSGISRHAKYVNDPREDSVANVDIDLDSKPQISRQHRYVNVPPYHLRRRSSPPVNEDSDDTENAETPPPLPKKYSDDEDTTPNVVSPTLGGDDVFSDRQTRSPTPPLPERRYEESDVHSPSPPPLPDRRYESLSPPPELPQRYYSSVDEPKGKASGSHSRKPEPLRLRVRNGYEVVDLDEDDTLHKGSSGSHSKISEPRHHLIRDYETVDFEPPEASSSKQTKKRIVQRAQLQSGKEYAIVNPAWKRDASGRPPSLCESLTSDPQSPPPPLPDRTPESTEVISPSKSEQRYVELDLIAKGKEGSNLTRTNSDPYKDDIAYAIVKLDQRSKSRGERTSREVTPPEPYEVPWASPPRGVPPPSYAEIGFQAPSDQCTAEGYMEIDREVQNKYLQKAFSVPPDSQLPKIPENEHTTSPPPPPLPSRKSKDGKELSGSRLRKSKSSDGEWSNLSPRGSPDIGSRHSGEIPESFLDSLKYDLPLNSRRLHAMNVTLRKPPDDTSPGYSTFSQTREAVLLRSGVTLRRSISSMSPLLLRAGGSLDDSESGSSQADDDGLEPVNKCIKSLENSLRLKNGGQCMKLEKAPKGPPKWMDFKRRPHEYEDIKDGTEMLVQPRLTSPGTTKSLTDLDVPDMEWDEAEFGTSTTSQMSSSSQPNLVSSSSFDESFPHLVKPGRVSDSAFQLRVQRLKQHKYEDLDITEWPDVTPSSMGSQGDVKSLKSAFRSSLMEGDKKLPKGWKKMEDEAGKVYYWHVPTGKTQYTKPTQEEHNKLCLTPSPDDAKPPKSSKGSSDLDQQEGGTTSPPLRVKKSQTFSARYLGYHSVQESELVPGRCVKVVHACINRTNAGMRSPQEERRVSKGKVVFLQIHGMELRWLNPETSSATTVQPINRIRVWGIGLENERDFGYVARDLSTKKHKCHVFRCDMPARAVARALLESHQREKRARTSQLYDQSSMEKPLSSTRPKDSRVRSMSPDYNPAMESMAGVEKRRSVDSILSTSSVVGDKYMRIPCTYIGSCDVPKPAGMEVLNGAVEKLSTSKRRWVDVNVDIATSHIKISDIKTDTVVREHRVRFLCFLGIAKDDRYCGYVIDSGEKGGEKYFQFHGFKREPNTDQLCLALHAACQERYQRVLDANPEAARKHEEGVREEKGRSTGSKSASPSLFSRLGSLRKTKKTSDEESKAHSFVVQYLGSQQVSKPEGLETVKEPVQQLSALKASPQSSPHLVEFEVSPSGLCVTDPQRKAFSRKNFNVKNITYVVRIRNYFAFVAKESGKYHCYVFCESEVDAGTIVTTIQKLLAPESVKQEKK